MPVLLYVAGREGRLVRGDADDVALLEPPAAGWSSPDGRGVVVRALGLVDRQWERIVLALPAISLLVCLALIVRASPSWALLAAFLAILQVFAVVATLFVASIKWMVREFGPAKSAAGMVQEGLAEDCWTLSLCHQNSGAEAALIWSRIVERFSTLPKKSERRGQDRLLIYPRSANSTDASVALWRDLGSGLRPFADAELLVVDAQDTPARAPTRALAGGRGPAWSFPVIYLTGVLLTLIAIAAILSQREQAGFLAFFKHLLHRLVFIDDPSLEIRSAQGRVIGWLVSVMGAVSVAVAVTGLTRAIRAVRRGPAPDDEPPAPPPPAPAPAPVAASEITIRVPVGGADDTAGPAVAPARRVPRLLGSGRGRKAVGLGLAAGLLWWLSSGADFWRGFVAGLVVNELTDVSPWVADRLLEFAALHWITDGAEGQRRYEPWKQSVGRCPGKTLKLVAAVALVAPVFLGWLTPGFGRAAGRVVAPLRKWAGAAVSARSSAYLVASLATVGAALLVWSAGSDRIDTFVKEVAAGNAGGLRRSLTALLAVLGTATVILLVLGGVRYVTSGGSRVMLSQARNVVGYATYVLCVAIASYAAVTFVVTGLR
ncbi:hypothetical protein DMB66_54000 [Actinoplanes sp. ATCC 53533]|uniref:hypothetical protein n=1 Tax=Actinoplanes sp. ATCC 53533 TaxID=1288362 RepID=UPI000F773566|nr:hypothetical protein [Actinoplanes sp. ATCC 53533]RSM42918.1 hypothetical protein DMB66_54000 [Actinoplanes sp. ATCC 53533]